MHFESLNISDSNEEWLSQKIPSIGILSTTTLNQ